MIGIDRLGQEIESAFLHRRDRILNVAEGGHHDHRQFGIELLRKPEHPETVALGKSEIGENHGGTDRLQRGGGLGLIARFDDGVALGFERVPKHDAQRILVLDEQDRWISCLAGTRAHRSQPAGTPERRASS